MMDPDPLTIKIKSLPERTGLLEQVALMQEKCIDCPKCVAECAFLKHYGTPGKIAGTYDPEDRRWLSAPFECNLCGLCAAVCPKGLNPADMFFEMRREAVDRGAAPFPEHSTMLAYEKRGTSKRFSWYSLPENCDTVLFPGCTLTGTRPETTMALFKHLKKKHPDLGIVLDCCCKPSHDLGRQSFFAEMFGEMKSYLVENDVKTIIAACPNCYKVFKSYGHPLEVISAYEVVEECGLPETGHTNQLPAVSIHDPCVLRQEDAVHRSVRQLAESCGFSISEMPHSRDKTLCCGEGGSACFVSEKFSGTWQQLRKTETNDLPLLTYCAGCAGALNRHMPTAHILDAVFNPEALADGTLRSAKAPRTYFNRLKVKHRLKKDHPAAVCRERNFYAQTPVQKHPARYAIVLFITAAIAGFHFLDGAKFMDPETLKQAVASWGAFAPMIYMLIYAAAPALFLPGLPITIAGGILFGPFWGVVYSISGATAGACVAFLVARYLARDWVREKLRGPRWEKLDQGVETHGWKIVAFTRLVPLFPFNLLNYAFGLTAVNFLPYAVTSFVCMLPACIAFIVFSSSFPDLIRGNLSPGFIAGLLLVGIVSLIPVMIKKFAPKGT